MPVTEAEWLAATDPIEMLDWVQGKYSERKLRLFTCVCSRHLWHLLTDPRSRAAVVVAERFADGLAEEPERHAASAAAQSAVVDAIRDRQQNTSIPEMFTLAARVARFSLEHQRGPEQVEATVSAYRLVSRNPSSGLLDRAAVNATSSAALRDILGNPSRPNPTMHPAWRSDAVLQLTQAAYDDRRLPEGTLNPSRLGLLADALEDAGCTDAELLGHLRGPGPRILLTIRLLRGCVVFRRSLDLAPELLPLFSFGLGNLRQSRIIAHTHERVGRQPAAKLRCGSGSFRRWAD
jgi:hypothetical protein